jgi:hypothetical protein
MYGVETLFSDGYANPSCVYLVDPIMRSYQPQPPPQQEAKVDNPTPENRVPQLDNSHKGSPTGSSVAPITSRPIETGRAAFRIRYRDLQTPSRGSYCSSITSSAALISLILVMISPVVLLGSWLVVMVRDFIWVCRTGLVAFGDFEQHADYRSQSACSTAGNGCEP